MIKILKHPARFSISYKNKKYKIFSYFSAANDTSFALHSYFNGKALGRFHFDGDYNSQTIDISKVDKKEFLLHKTNFHDSGMVSQKDKFGKGPNKNIKSKAFKEVDDCITLFFIQPTTLDKYPEIDNKQYIPLDNSGQNILPPIIQGYLCKESYNFQEEFVDKQPEGNYFIDENFFSEFNLVLYIYVRKYKYEIFPSGEITGVFEF